MAIVNGTAINFGFKTSAGITITGISGILLQSIDHSAEADIDSVRNNIGDIVAQAYYDPRFVATIEWAVSGTDFATAITNSALANLLPGTIIVVTACASRPELIQSNWTVQTAKVSGQNVSHAVISITVHRRAGITATVGTFTS